MPLYEGAAKKPIPVNDLHVSAAALFWMNNLSDEPIQALVICWEIVGYQL